MRVCMCVWGRGLNKPYKSALSPGFGTSWETCAGDQAKQGPIGWRVAKEGGAGQVRTCGGRPGPPTCQPQMRAGEAAAGGARCGTALSEDQDLEIIKGHSQAPGPPLPPRDEPLAQTGPERFVRSARVRQGRPLSTRPEDQPDRHAGTGHRRRHAGRRGCAPLPGDIRLPSGPTRFALSCPGPQLLGWAAGLRSG